MRRVPLILAALLVVGWAVGLQYFAASLPDTADPATAKTDAIVVLTGGSGRLIEGLDLLKTGLAEKLFVSGVYRGVDVEELLRVTQAGGEPLARKIVLGHDADDTLGNARDPAIWLAEEGYSILRLVTAAYHMPRSLFEFRRALPGVEIVAHPVFPPLVRLDAWWRYPGTMSLVAGEYSKVLMAHARVWLNDRWREISGWLG